MRNSPHSERGPFSGLADLHTQLAQGGFFFVDQAQQMAVVKLARDQHAGVDVVHMGLYRVKAGRRHLNDRALPRKNCRYAAQVIEHRRQAPQALVHGFQRKSRRHILATQCLGLRSQQLAQQQ